ncbi:ATPase inhibitor mai-2, mitochondrial-like [Procambarus clarkii]|uniref:ATPase inhibitor mai-2, mitochondrial-like n=1 Tax=Procambarus clarkii TaxID=6728 RepID=UPI001E676E01|nr:ATPase inhibitor mai-2, mitochondrial-like [Procambarus clarkii]
MTDSLPDMALRSATACSLRAPLALCARGMSSGEAGSGAGYGGGSGGAIKDAGGAFGKREVALEEQYYRKLQYQQIEKMKAGIEEEVHFHKEQVQAHKDAIKRHHRILDELMMSMRNIVARDKLSGNDS